VLYRWFSSGIGIIFALSSSQWEERAMPEKIYQTLLINKKQGHLDYVHAANIIKPTQARINPQENTLCYKIIGVFFKHAM
jgi:hypothetical protein